MNLNAYDILEHNFKYWIWIPRKTMYLKEIKSREYYSFLCRYNKDYNNYDIYILFTDKKVDKNDIQYHKLNKTVKNIFRIYLDNIWDLLKINTNLTNIRINLVLEEKSDNGELYKIDFEP